MSDVLVQFDEPQPATDGRLFIAQVNGQRIANGLWEAWIEFYPRDGGEPFRTGRETEQLTRGDLRYWAAGLTHVYLQGALVRALSPERKATPINMVSPDFGGRHGLNGPDERTHFPTALPPLLPAALDPLELYSAGGEYRLRQELRALDAMQLQDVIAAYDIPEVEFYDAVRTFEDALTERIVASVQHRVRSRGSRSQAAPALEQLG